MSILTLGLLLLGAGPQPLAPSAASAVVCQDAAQRLAAIQAEYSKDQRAFYERLQKLADPAEVERLMREENPLVEYIDRFRELAFDAAGTETGVRAWIWVGNLCLDNDRVEEAREALGVLLDNHLDSPALAEVATSLRYTGPRLGGSVARDALTRILEGSPHAGVRAPAQFSLGQMLAESGDAAEKARGRALLEEMPAKYADVEGGWAELAKGLLYELDHLQVGMLAPDFEAVDVDGVSWKLSDYRGKVVIVDFWGFW